MLLQMPSMITADLRIRGVGLMAFCFRRVYPPPCKECGGKGRIKEAVN
jgi:hypothetical protein